MAVQAIPTSYHGHTFRSKLETRWARVFDLLGIPWEYEPEARRTDHGGYLPDFYLPAMKGGTWLEVKPTERRVAPEDPRWLEFAIQRRQPLVIAFGLPDPYGARVEMEPGVCWKVYPTGEGDHDHRLTMCAVCGEPGFEFEGRGARACRTKLRCYGRENADKAPNANDGRILAALTEARAMFVGTLPLVAGRTLPDDVVDGLATELVRDTAAGQSISRWLDARALSPADREAVLLAWGRLVE